MQAHGIMFHHFHDDRHPRAQGSMDAVSLRKMLVHLGSGHRILSAKEFQARAIAGALHPEDICLTFDDSLRCQYDVATPVLTELGLTAFWFIYTSPICGVMERLELYRYFRNTAFACIEDFYSYFFNYVQTTSHGRLAEEALLNYDPSAFMSRFPGYSVDDCRFRHLRDDVFGEDIYYEVMDDILQAMDFNTENLLEKLWLGQEEIRSLHREGHVIGLHSHTHPTRIGLMPRERQMAEYVENKRILEDITGEAIVSMSHPSNSYGAETLEVLTLLGAQVGFRAFMTGGGGGPLELPRQDHSNLMRLMETQP